MKTVEIYTLDYCPFCQKAKIFLNEHGVKYTEIPCDDSEEEKREELTQKYHLNTLATFPQIIIDGENIGGYSDLIDKFNSNLISFE